MSQPTHYFIGEDGEVSIVNPDGYDGLAKPLPKGFWDTPKVWTGKAWAEDIEGERARLWAEVKARRDALIAGGCDTPSGRVDTDAKSQAAISELAALARNDPAFADEWTMEDNSRVPVDAKAMIDIWTAFLAHRSAARKWADDIRDRLDAATTIAELWDAVPPSGD